MWQNVTMKCDTPECDELATTRVTVIMTGDLANPDRFDLCGIHAREMAVYDDEFMSVKVTPLESRCG